MVTRVGSMKVLSALVISLALPISATAADACESLVPASLKAAVLKEFDGYRLPQEKDNLPEDVTYAKEHAESACLGVATADFDGDGKPDYLIALTATQGPGALIIVALSRGSGWKLHKLDAWKDSRSRLYVEADPPGTYDDVGDRDGPLEEGQLEHLQCPNSVAVFGLTESSGVAFCLLGSTWKHVWISD
jgi:hypothetical protein